MFVPNLDRMARNAKAWGYHPAVASSAGFILGWNAFGSWPAALGSLALFAAYSEAKRKARLETALRAAMVDKVPGPDGRYTFTPAEIGDVMREANGPPARGWLVVVALLLFAVAVAAATFGAHQ